MTAEEKRIVQLKERLFNWGARLPGSLSKQGNVCGSAGCKGKHPERPVKPGPDYPLSYTLKGQSSTVFVKKAVLQEVYARMKCHQEFRALCDALGKAYIAAFRRQGLEGKST